MQLQRRDFFTQEQLLNDWEPPEDWFQHSRLARIFHQRAKQLPPGSTIGIQGGWGAGKTDLLARVFVAERNSRTAEFKGNEKDAQKLQPIWINPWKQSVPDVISPITHFLVERLNLKQSDKKRILGALVSAGAAFAQKAAGAGLVAAGDPISGAALMGIPSLLSTYRKAKNGEYLEWNDPVVSLGYEFKKLVSNIISEEEARFGNRLLICIDDLDRCPPAAQVQILESIVFLASAGAPITIYMGLDPRIITTSIMNRYQINDFDAEQYLAKIFTTRFHLPERSSSEIGRAIQHILREDYPTESGVDSLHDIIQQNLGISPGFFANAGQRIFHHEKLGRARLIRKVMHHLYLFASSKPELQLRDASHAETLLIWLTIVQQTPESRPILLNEDTSTVLKFLDSNLPILTSEILRNTNILEYTDFENNKQTLEPFLKDVRSLDPYLQRVGL